MLKVVYSPIRLHGCFSLVTGKLADIFGGKRMCLLGMAIFTSCSVASGFVKSMEPLFVCRGLSGLGSAMASTAGYRKHR